MRHSAGKCPPAGGDRRAGRDQAVTNRLQRIVAPDNLDRLPTRRELLDRIEALSILVNALAADRNRLTADLAHYVVADVGRATA